MTCGSSGSTSYCWLYSLANKLTYLPTYLPVCWVTERSTDLLTETSRSVKANDWQLEYLRRSKLGIDDVQSRTRLRHVVIG